MYPNMIHVGLKQLHLFSTLGPMYMTYEIRRRPALSTAGCASYSFDKYTRGCSAALVAGAPDFGQESMPRSGCRTAIVVQKSFLLTYLTSVTPFAGTSGVPATNYKTKRLSENVAEAMAKLSHSNLSVL